VLDYCVMNGIFYLVPLRTTMTNLNRHARKFLLLLLSWTVILPACTKTGQQPGVYSVYNVTGIPEAIYWEQVCQYVTGIYGMYASPGLDVYNSTDPYIVDIHKYYQDICSSYTDSIFTTDDSDNKILVSHARYFNTVVMKGDTVSRVVKTNEAGQIMRNIELKY
jgi:hypothetical protein